LTLTSLQLYPFRPFRGASATLKAAVFPARGKPRSIGPIVPDLLKSVSDLGGAGLGHSYKSTLNLPEQALFLQCKLYAASFLNGIPAVFELQSFVEEGLPYSMFIGEVKTAAASGAPQPFPKF
jgi:hypothetical protein